MNIRNVAKLIGALVFLFVLPSAKGQTTFELTCPPLTSSIQSLQTQDNVTGKGRQNACVDNSGNLTFNNGVSGTSGNGTPGSVPQNVVNPANFGVTMNAKMCRDTNAQWTTGVGVTCLTGNFCNNTSIVCANGQITDIGKIIFGTCCGLSGGVTHQQSTLQLPQGTITAVNSPTSVTVSLAGTTTTCASGAANCLLIWGTDDTAGWNAAWAAATGTAGHCGGIQVGAGMSLVQTALFLTTVCNTGITGSGSQGASINGMGYKASQFIPTPNFSAASCVGVTLSFGNVNCFGPSSGFQFSNFGIWGAEYGNQAALTGKTFLNVGVDSYLTNILLAGLASLSSSGMVGVNFEASGQTTNTMIVDGFGAGNGSTTGMCTVTQGSYNAWVQPFCGNTGGPSLVINNAARLTAYNGGWGGNQLVTNPDVINNGFFTDIDGVFFNTTVAATDLAVGTLSTTKLRGSNLLGNGNGGASSLFYNNAAGAKVYALDSFFQGGGTNLDVTFLTAMGFFQDQGGNSYFHTNTAITPTCVITTGGGTSPACNLVSNVGTNEKGTIRMLAGTAPGTSGTITLTFSGAGFLGGNGQTASCNFTYAQTGTGTWTPTAPVMLVSRTTTNVVLSWAAVLTGALTYDIDYQCTSK